MIKAAQARLQETERKLLAKTQGIEELVERVQRAEAGALGSWRAAQEAAAEESSLPRSEEKTRRTSGPPGDFACRLERKSLGEPLGLNFCPPEMEDQPFMRVAEVLPSGLVDCWNMRESSSGNLHRVVRPGIAIVGVNGVRGDFKTMMEELRCADLLEILFQAGGADDGLAPLGGPTTGPQVAAPPATLPQTLASRQSGTAQLPAEVAKALEASARGLGAAQACIRCR